MKVWTTTQTRLLCRQGPVMNSAVAKPSRAYEKAAQRMGVIQRYVKTERTLACLGSVPRQPSVPNTGTAPWLGEMSLLVNLGKGAW